MNRIFSVLVFTVALTLTIRATNSFAQFGGRGGIFGGSSRGGRGDHRGDLPNQGNPIERPAPGFYEQIEHRLVLMEVDLRLAPEQQGPWLSFAQKVRAYASDLSRERARIGVPAPEGTTISGLQQIDQATENARSRVAELEEIRAAANALYAALSPDQKKIADTRIAAIIAPTISVRRDE